jgi:hypothetical protein
MLHNAICHAPLFFCSHFSLLLRLTSLTSFSQVSNFFGFSPRSRRLRATSQRLGAVAASTNIHAGDKCSITQFLFRGVTAAIAPNRKLCAGIFPRIFIAFSTELSDVISSL